MISIQKSFSGLSIVTDREFPTVVAKIKAAYDEGLLEQGLRYFTKPESSLFCYHDGEVLMTCRMRDNGNGWHDVGAYALPDFRPVGTMFRSNPDNGTYRDSIEV